MVRKDREITDKYKIQEIIKKCICCRLGFIDNNEVYIVPLNFGYEIDNDNYIFYFHGAKAGRKIDLIKSNPYVGFEMDRGYKIKESDIPCKYSARYQSIIGNGIVHLVDDPVEKKKGLILLMGRNTGKSDWNLDERMISSVSVFKLEVTKLSCKEHE